LGVEMNKTQCYLKLYSNFTGSELRLLEVLWKKSPVSTTYVSKQLGISYEKTKEKIKDLKARHFILKEGKKYSPTVGMERLVELIMSVESFGKVTPETDRRLGEEMMEELYRTGGERMF
jgi:DNA-binding Lrp family transcriptional regulator